MKKNLNPLTRERNDMTRKRHKSKLEKAEEAHEEVTKQAFEKGAPKSRLRRHVLDGDEVYKEKQDVMVRYTPILWGIPADEVMFSKFHTHFIRNSNMMPWDDYVSTESTYLPDARNEIHNSFINDSDYPYLMMIDSDVMFPRLMVERLMSYKLPIVGGWYKNKHWAHEPHPIVYDYLLTFNDRSKFKHRDKPGEGLERVDAMGAGCWLISRECAEAIGESPYDTAKGGEDLRFSKQLMDLDIPMHVDWDIECAYIGVSSI